MEIVRLSERMDLVPALARAFLAEWPEWYGSMGSPAVEAELSGRAGAGLPAAFVAMEEGGLAGSATLAEAWDGAPDVGPWLMGLWVPPERRGRGVATALATRVADEARVLGFPSLFAATAHAQSLFLRSRWERLSSLDRAGEMLSVLRLDLQR